METMIGTNLEPEQVLNNTDQSESKSVKNISSEISENSTDQLENAVEATEESEKDDEWLDILGSGQLLKKIIKKGEPDTRPQRLDVCTVKYVGKLDENVVDEGEVTVNVGDAEVIQGLDFVLPLMDLNEEAEVIVGPRFAFGSEGRQPDIPPDATLRYYVTLLHHEPETPMEHLTIQRRKDIGNQKKERGNYWYTRKNHTLAIQCYRRALEYLDYHEAPSSEEIKTESKEEEEVHSLLEDRIKVYNNLAAAQLKIKAFDSALQAVENVLRCEPNNVKALFRKGKILAEKGETEESISLLNKTLHLDPDNVQAKNERNQLLARQKKDTAQQRNLYKKMLGTNKPAEKRASSPTREVRRWGMMVGFVGAIFSIIVAYKWYKPV